MAKGKKEKIEEELSEILGEAEEQEIVEESAADSADENSEEPEYITLSKEEYENIKGEAESNYNAMLRARADYENLKKRNQNIAQDMYFEGKKDAVSEILPVIDNIDRALAIEMPDGIREGISAVRKQFTETLTKLGVEEIAAEGEVFDPNVHNALMQVDNDEMSGKIVQVYQKGYRIGDRVIRHASVVVAK